MKLMLLALLAFAQLISTSAVHARDALSTPTTLAQADTRADRGIQSIEEAPAPKPDKSLDINVTVGDPPPSSRWYAQPIWIAVFIIGGMAFLTLLAMAFRGSNATGGTIVKG